MKFISLLRCPSPPKHQTQNEELSITVFAVLKVRLFKNGCRNSSFHETLASMFSRYLEEHKSVHGSSEDQPLVFT